VTIMTRQTKLCTRVVMRFLVGSFLLFGAASGASAHWAHWNSTSNEDVLSHRGYYGTPYGGGPQFGNGGGDQFGYGPGYSYARQAPSS
jgi:hypothetical protein